MADIPTNPVTREEQYLNAMAGGAGSLPEEPVTRVEKYLAAILENGGSGGGSGGGTTNYNQLLNKPKINGVELSGNKTSADLGIGGGGTEDYEALNNQPLIEGVKVIGSKNAEDYNLASKTYVDTNIGNIEVLLGTI